MEKWKGEGGYVGRKNKSLKYFSGTCFCFKVPD